MTTCWNNANAELEMLRKSVDALYATYCETEKAYAQLIDSHNYTDAEEKKAYEKVYAALMEYRKVSNKINFLEEEIRETAE